MQNEIQPRTTISESLEREGYQVTPALRASFAEIEKKVPPEVQSQLVRRDGAAQLVDILPRIVPLADVAGPEGEGVWYHCSWFYYSLGRFNEAPLSVFFPFESVKEHRKGDPLLQPGPGIENRKWQTVMPCVQRALSRSVGLLPDYPRVSVDLCGCRHH